jgi:ElaB/YqjD/DUF883 family membrane-anchored ribosome-binding protein
MTHSFRWEQGILESGCKENAQNQTCIRPFMGFSTLTKENFMSTKADQIVTVTKGKIIEDVKVLSKDVQELIKVTASVVGEKADEARVRVQESLKVAQDKLAALPEAVKGKSKEAVALTDQYVRENPWTAVGIATGVGFLIGLGFAAGTCLRRRD